jgi:hypothetical protein
MTEQWHSGPWWGPWPPRTPIQTGCGNDPWNAPCTLAWGSAPDLRRYLIETLGYSHYSLAQVKQANPDESPPDVSEILQSIKIEPGDVVFYRDLEQDHFGHAALVTGWGPPTYFRAENVSPYGCNTYPWGDTARPGQLPWIVDHTGPGFKRAFNDIENTAEVDFVHIPDLLRQLS